jgi:hypothetical protein
MRGLDRVRAEFRLSTLAYNIKRVMSIVGIGPLLASLKLLGPKVDLSGRQSALSLFR